MGEKQQWSNEHIKCLLETCIEEINSVGKKGLSLHKDSWIKLGRVLKEKFGLDLTQKQMKNAYDNLKAKYIGWVYLKNKTGNIYNAETNTFTLTNEEWEEFKKGHPKAGALKTVPLPFPDLCAALFDGNTATGNCKWTSTQTTSMVGSSSCQRVQQLLLTNSVFHDTEDDAGTSHQTSEPIPDHTSDPNFEPASEPIPEPTREPTPESNPRKKSKTTKSSSINADDLAHDMRKALQYLIKGNEGPTVAVCSEKLKLVGLDPVDPLFLAAFHIFGVSTGMREAWMALPDIPDVLRGWIAMTATSLGALTNKEKFNHAHAKLRNVIERAFGVLKARFPILKRMASFPLVTQRNIVIACFALHNFIRKEGLSDEFFTQYDQPNVWLRNTHIHDNADGDEVEGNGSASDREYMNRIRDEIAEQLMQNME